VALRQAIKREKARAWDELLHILDDDPWGRPYKIVFKKMKGGATPVTETLDPQFVNTVVETLFPDGEGVESLPPLGEIPEWDEDELVVTQGELKDAVARIKSRKAPGPDGVHGRAWVLAFSEMAEDMRHVFGKCLKKGSFPLAWRRAKLVLLPKKGKPGGGGSR